MSKQTAGGKFAAGSNDPSGPIIRKGTLMSFSTKKFIEIPSKDIVSARFNFVRRMLLNLGTICSLGGVDTFQSSRNVTELVKGHTE